MQKDKLWTGSFVGICLVNLFIFVNFHSLLPTFPFFITHLGGDAVAIGMATALFSLASIISRPFLGWLTDTRGRFTMLIIGLVGMSLLPMGYFASAGIAMAVALRTVHGAFHAASSNAASTWVTDIIPRSRMGEGLGMYGLSMALSTAIAPALGLAVMNVFGFTWLFGLATLAGLLAIGFGVSIKNRNYTLSKEPLRVSQLFESMAIPASVTQFFYMLAYGVVEVYVAIYATTHGLPSGGLYFIVIAIATVATRFALGRAIDKYGEARLVYSGNAAALVAILLLVLSHNVPSYVLSALLLGYSFGAVQPSLQTMAMHAVAPERRGAASSTFYVAFDLGIALGGFLAGLLIKWIGYDAMFLIIAVFCIFSTAYYFKFGRNHASSFNPALRRGPEAPTVTINDVAEELPLVVTISREYGSGGREIGRLLAEKLKVKLYDKQIIALTAGQSGLSEQAVSQGEQAVDGRLVVDDPLGDRMFLAQREVIADIAHREPCVIVGRLANFILAGRAHVFRIFVYADKSSRMERCVNRYGIPEKEVKALLERKDRERAEHCMHYTGYVYGDCHYYDLMVNSGAMGEEAAAELIHQIILHNHQPQG